MGTRSDCPGTVIVGLSEERLRRDDIVFTASQLFHEHGHLKLSLYLSANRIELSGEPVFVSPFKNEARELETILHTAYTIGLECMVRLALAVDEEGDQRERTLAYLAAVAARLELTAEAGALGLRVEDPAPLHAIPSLALEAVNRVRAALRDLPEASQEAHEAERRRVLDRHGWDVGQFLIRGVDVRDPGLEDAHVENLDLCDISLAQRAAAGCPWRAAAFGGRLRQYRGRPLMRDRLDVAVEDAVRAEGVSFPRTLAELQINRHLHRTLISRRPDGSSAPSVASTWRVSRSGLQWTFELASGHRYHDGSLVDADSVAWNLATRLLPVIGSSMWIGNIRVRGAREVVIQTTRPVASLLDRLASPYASLVSPRSWREGRHVGCGPFKRESISTNTSLRVWKEDKIRAIARSCSARFVTDRRCGSCWWTVLSMLRTRRLGRPGSPGSRRRSRTALPSGHGLHAR